MKHKLILNLLLFVLITLSVQGAVFENQTTYNYDTVNYVFNQSFTLTNLTIYGEGIILNDTDNISFTHSGTKLNITMYNWTSVNNSFDMIGSNQSVTFIIKTNNQNSTLKYNNTEQSSPFNATDRILNFSYGNATIPDVNYSASSETYTANITILSDRNINLTLYQSNYSDMRSPQVITNSTFGRNFTQKIEGLIPNTLFYYQVNGSSSFYAVYSSTVKNFTTRALNPVGDPIPTTGGGGGGAVVEQTFLPIDTTKLSCQQNTYDNIEFLRLNYTSVINLKDQQNIQFKVDVLNNKQTPIVFKDSAVKIYYNNQIIPYLTTTDQAGKRIDIYYALDINQCGVGTFDYKIPQKGTYKFIIDVLGYKNTRSIEFFVNVVDDEFTETTAKTLTNLQNNLIGRQVLNNYDPLTLVMIVLIGLVAIGFVSMIIMNTYNFFSVSTKKYEK